MAIEIERLKTTCFNLNNKAAIADDLRRENEVLNRRLEESEGARSELETQNRSFKTEISSLNRRLEESEGARSELETQNRSFKTEISSLKNDLRASLSSNTELQQALDEAADYNISMEEKVYKSNKISLDLLKEVKEMEVHIRNLEF